MVMNDYSGGYSVRDIVGCGIGTGGDHGCYIKYTKANHWKYMWVKTK